MKINGETLVIHGEYNCEYLKSPIEMELLNEERTVVAGYARRTGITRPGYPDRAVYRIVLSFEKPQDGYYVYDGGELVPIDEWYRYQSVA